LLDALPLVANEQCTDHSSFYHPGYDPADPCPVYDVTTANQLLDSNGWVRGSDGVLTKTGQRLEFEYSLPIIPGDLDRLAVETIIQRNLQAIGIKLDIQNIPEEAFFNGAFHAGEASPPTGAFAGRDDILEIADVPVYDPDDSSLFSCNQFPPNGGNFVFYCNHTLDALYQQELTTPDPGARQNIFAQIHLIYLKDFPWWFSMARSFYIWCVGERTISSLHQLEHSSPTTSGSGGAIMGRVK
jgi:peptide/nickel transport system substrate-binding protein